MLFEMQEEITVLICAYFLELSIPKLYTWPHILLNYSSTCEKISESNVFGESDLWRGEQGCFRWLVYLFWIFKISE